MDFPNGINDMDYVEAPEGKTNLLLADEKQQARFELGVSMMVYKWDALDVAVANQWGGPDSADKRDWVTSVLIDLFKTEKVVDVHLLEETLVYAMFDEFDAHVDDGSAMPIAASILEIYRQCLAEDYSAVEKFYLEWLQRKDEKVDRHVEVYEPDPTTDPEDEDGDDDDEEQDVNMDETVPEVMESSVSEPIIDEDGFEVVQKKGRRRG